MRFGHGATVAEAAAAAGLEPDEAVAEAVRAFVAAGLIVPRDFAPNAAPAGRAAARGRIAELVDPGTFDELDGGSIVTGFGAVGGQRVAVAAWEPGATAGIEALLQLQERVLAAPCPLVYLFDLFSIGRDAADFASPRAIGRVYANQGRLSGLAPQVGVVFGSLFRPAAFLPAGCDVVIMVEGRASVTLADADAVKEFTGETVTREELGGARMHAETSGLCHLLVRSDAEAASLARRYLSYMPSSAATLPAAVAPIAPTVAPGVLDAMVPEEPAKPFPILELAAGLFDGGSLLPVRDGYARELTTALARLDGIAVGVVANRSEHKGGIFTGEAADKAARFVSLCDAYGLPIVFLVDVPGVAIGRAAERAGIERAAARLYAALATSAVPRLTLVVRKAHTAGLYAMSGPAFDPDAFLALPGAAIAVFGERMFALERQLDAVGAASVRSHQRAQRPPLEPIVDEVVAASAARAALTARLHAALAAPRPRLRRTIPA